MKPCQAALLRLAVALPLIEALPVTDALLLADALPFADALPLADAFIGALPLAVPRALSAALPFALSFGFLGLPSLPKPIPFHSATKSILSFCCCAHCALTPV